MALIARVKTWLTGDILTAADLNGEFNIAFNVINGGLTEVNLGILKYLDLSNTTATETIKVKSTVSDTAFLIYS